MKLAAAERHDDLYPDRHLNVFVPYGTHTLDYNVTRALVTTLRWSRPELTQAVLQELAGVSVAADVGFQYDLHACDYEDFDPSRVETQVVLGISIQGALASSLPPLDDGELQATLLGFLRSAFSPAQKLEEVRRVLARPELSMDELETLHHTLEELEDGCLPDGWVFSPKGGVCVLIEAKLLNLLDLSQLQRYADVYYQRQFQASDMRLATWERVAEVVACFRDDADVRTAFLCRQLHDYFDLLGLAPFGGFKPYDFDLDTIREALPKFQRFAAALRNQATEQGLPLGPPRPSPTGVRVAFSEEAYAGELALDLLEQGVRVELRCGDGPGARGAVDRLLETTHDGETNPLAGQDLGGLYVRLERLRSSDADGETFVELETLKEELNADEFGFVLSELRRNHPPAEAGKGIAGYYRRGTLSLGRIIERDAAIGGDSGVLDACLAAVASVVRAARALGSVPATA